MALSPERKSLSVTATLFRVNSGCPKIRAVETGPVGEVRTLKVGTYSSITVASMTLLDRAGRHKVLVLLFRGERSH